MGDAVASMRLLHVDDEPEFTDLTAEFLEREDDRFDVETATSADAALEHLAEGAVDCVISDYDMPGRNGLEFLAAVRDEFPDLPFVLYTGKGSEEVASDAITAGVSDYLQKQAGTDQYTLLANRVRNAIEGYRATQAVEETRRRFRTLVEEATDVILILAPDGTISYATPSAESILGRSPEDLVGTNGFDPVRPEDEPTVMQAFSALIENPDERRTAEFRYEKPDGTEIWMEARGRNLLDDPIIEGLVVYARDATDRKERELVLQRRERRYQAIFNDPNILVGLIDIDGTVLHINETALEYVDANADELTGTAFWETPWFNHSTEVQNEVREWIEQARNGNYVEFEVDLHRPDGEPYTVQGVFRPVTDADGEVVSLIISDREITAQKERERELERIRDFFTEAEHLGRLGAWEFDADGNVVWTEGTRRIHEVTGDYEPSIDDGIEFFHPDDRATISEAVEGALESGDPYDIEARLITAKDNERWVRARGQSVGDDESTVRGYIQDITARKEREQEVTRANSQLEAAVEAGAVGTWEWHVPTDHLVAGPEFARTFGVDPDDARSGVPLERFTSSIHEDDRDRVVAEIEAALEACEDYEAEYRVRNADGESRWVVARGTVECDQAGNPQSFPGALIDITERKETERKLRRQNDRLDEFASVVSHDLRNPLSVAEGHLQLAREDCDNEHLDRISRSHERMESLIDDLLALSREVDSLAELESVELGPVVANSWENVKTAGATLSNDADLAIRGEERRLRRLFENLFRNAIEHGGDDVDVTVGVTDDGFFVEDDGPGIPTDARDAVFEAGYSTARLGTGFGLRIVKQVVDAHEWSITVTEGADGGARFDITGIQVETR